MVDYLAAGMTAEEIVGDFPDSAHVTTLGLKTATVLEVLIDHHEMIEAFENAAEEALLVVPGLPRE